MPNAADRTAGRCSVMTRSPPGRTVRITAAAPALAVAGAVAITVPALPAAAAVTIIVAVAVAVMVAGVSIAVRRHARRGLALDDLHRDQRQLAAVVHLADL